MAWADDIRAVEAFFARTAPKTPDGKEIRDDFIRWYRSLSWFQRMMPSRVVWARAKYDVLQFNDVEQHPSAMGYEYPYSPERRAINASWYAQSKLSGFAGNPTELPNKITKVTPDEAAKALAEGYQRVTGKKASSAILALLLGQWALETGNGAYVHNYNFGNTKRSSSDQYYQYFRCSEIIGGKEVFFDPPAPECSFSAYKTAADGAEAYVKILKKRPNWWNGLQTGDVVKFNEGLTTAPKYYTANPAQYLTTLKNRVANYLPQAERYGATLLSTYLQIATGLALGGAAVYGYSKVKR